jgi:ankyrin repeat protein
VDFVRSLVTLGGGSNGGERGDDSGHVHGPNCSHGGGGGGGGDVSLDVGANVFVAAKFGNVAALERFVAESREIVNAREDDGTMPLHWAALNGHLSAALLLLSHGALVDAPNKVGHTPLHWAAIGGHCKVLLHLVLRGADPLKVDSLGHNGLLHAAQYGNALACYFFLHADRFVQALDLPPALAAHTSLATPVSFRDLEGHTALHWAAYRGSLPTVRFLLQEGASLTEADNSGCTALHWSAIRKHSEVAKFLVNEGAPISTVDDQGKTPEAWALEKGAKQIVSLLRNVTQHPTLIGRAATQQLSHTTWFLIGSLGALLCGVLWVTQAWFVSWPAIAAVYFVARNRQRALLPGVSPAKTPVFVGVFCGLYAFSAIVYWTQIAVDFRAPDHPIPFWLHAVFVVANLGFLPYYYKLIHSNPGFVVKTEQNDIRAFVADVRASADKSGAASSGNAFGLCPTPNKQFCVSCGVLKPLRAKHCAVSDRCVVKFDHYCGWLSNAIGYLNYRMFVGMVASMCFIHLSFDWMCYQSVMRGRESFFSEWVDVWQTTPAIAWLCIVHALFGFWMSGLLLSHVHQVSAGYTTNEAMNRKRYWYLTAGPGGANPFDRGFVRGFREFLTDTEPDWRYLYDLPQLQAAAV